MAEPKKHLDKIIINELLCQAILGVKKSERIAKQNIVFHLTGWIDLSEAGEKDQLSLTVDYRSIQNRVVASCQSAHYYTLEALALQTARILCLEFGFEKAKVRVEKPAALALARAPAVELVRERSWFLARSSPSASPSPSPPSPSSAVPTLPPPVWIQAGEAREEAIVFLGIGANIGDRLAQIEDALALLAASGVARLEDTSSLYVTRAQYVTDQPDFLNCVARLRTRLDPRALLRELKAIEERLGRKPGGMRWGPRPIDLDILLWQQGPDGPWLRVAEGPELEVPHARMHERDFVLVPLAELAPEARHVVLGRTISQLLAVLPEGARSLPRVLPVMGRSSEAPGALLPLGSRTHVMAIVNVTPDSFSDGGEHSTPERAAQHAQRQAQAGASIVDVGAVSTRPDAEEVSEAEELARLLPALAAIRAVYAGPLSVDTYRASVARRAILDETTRATIVNDISGGKFDPDMFRTCAEGRVTLILGHTRGTPRDMTRHARYPHGVVAEVTRELAAQVQAARNAGLPRWRIVVDPGLGFAKTGDHNLTLLREGARFREALGQLPVLVGASRKRFLGELTGRSVPRERVLGSCAAAVIAASWADIVRVHDVSETVEVVAVADAVFRRVPNAAPA